MTNSILGALHSAFSADAVRTLAKTYPAPAESIQKDLNLLIPTVVTGVGNQASTPDGRQRLFDLLQAATFDTDPSVAYLADTDAHRERASEAGLRFWNSLFANRAEETADAVSAQTGGNVRVTRPLLGLVASVLMGYLYVRIKKDGLAAPQVAGLLTDEHKTARGMVPAGLITALPWLFGQFGDARAAAPAPVVERTDDRRGGLPWWAWLLGLLLLGIILLSLLRGCDKDTTTTAATTDTTQTMTGADMNGDTVASAVGGSVGGPDVRVALDLPNGRKLNVAENSFNFQLAKYLEDKNREPDRVFTFDNLTFDTDKATITAEARPNVVDLINIMQAYPSLKIRIEGHTDNTGDLARNRQLSAQRAQAVRQALLDAGVEANRVTTEEYGPTKPVASNDTEEGRQKNRRIDVRIVSA